MKTHSWRDRYNALPAARREKIEARVEETMREADLATLRSKLARMTQIQVAALLGVTQSSVSQLEGQTDVLLSSLAEYVRALGGELELVAHFGRRGDVRITQFDEVEEQLRGRVPA